MKKGLFKLREEKQIRELLAKRHCCKFTKKKKQENSRCLLLFLNAFSTTIFPIHSGESRRDANLNLIDQTNRRDATIEDGFEYMQACKMLQTMLFAKLPNR
ncbi:hypothetical protein T4B_4752 [Trichinella pseudospiralis]|uniref:Uncharacterized protein n=1 Tax=Trichinella pseudospiralis TaxID=6337 RepID=A0A0V1IGM4_TRIPS|nr:hypothetical protein T4B_656 [Trichinella pseudospiralis]KRZ26805.1 hypothetical protein T4B_4752 [Trichinella pseudospiralis]KRZ41026.1 hypothetical protein T4C_4815 [Trichinella pseudospiralis]